MTPGEHNYFQVKKAKKKKKGLRRASKKQSAALATYYVLRTNYLEAHPLCELCPNKSKDIHHKAGRGIHLNDVSLFQALCRPCHDYIHQHPAWARAHHYLL